MTKKQQMVMARFPSLTRKEMVQVNRELRKLGHKPIKRGYCFRFPDGREFCHDSKGVYKVR